MPPRRKSAQKLSQAVWFSDSEEEKDDAEEEQDTTLAAPHSDTTGKSGTNGTITVTDAKAKKAKSKAEDSIAGGIKQVKGNDESSTDEDSGLRTLFPRDSRRLRACMFCSIIKPYAEFVRDGCPNCSFLEMANSVEQVKQCVSDQFRGITTISDPARSWVARYQRLNRYIPGTYALYVEGQLPDSVVTHIGEDGHFYIPRDGTGIDTEEQQLFNTDNASKKNTHLPERPVTES